MKKVLAFAVVAVFAVVLATAMTGCGKSGEDTILDKTGDWFATIGKSESDANIIVAQRKANRVAARMQAGMKQAAEDMNRQMKKAFGN